MAAYAAMNQPITITRRASATDSEGRPTGVSPTTADTTGLVIELAGMERPQGGSLGEETMAQALLPFDADVKAQDMLTVTYASGSVVTYRVVAVHDAVKSLLVDLHRDL